MKFPKMQWLRFLVLVASVLVSVEAAAAQGFRVGGETVTISPATPYIVNQYVVSPFPGSRQAMASGVEALTQDYSFGSSRSSGIVQFPQAFPGSYQPYVNVTSSLPGSLPSGGMTLVQNFYLNPSPSREIVQFPQTPPGPYRSYESNLYRPLPTLYGRDLYYYDSQRGYAPTRKAYGIGYGSGHPLYSPLPGSYWGGSRYDPYRVTPYGSSSLITIVFGGSRQSAFGTRPSWQGQRNHHRREERRSRWR